MTSAPQPAPPTAPPGDDALQIVLFGRPDAGKSSLLFYLASYAVTNLGAFGIIALLGSRERSNDDLRDYAGLAHSHPALAALMAR